MTNEIETLIAETEATITKVKADVATAVASGKTTLTNQLAKAKTDIEATITTVEKDIVTAKADVSKVSAYISAHKHEIIVAILATAAVVIAFHLK
jgi:Ni2+-binding GTPase involved in maturation of urease and hydrogenase